MVENDILAEFRGLAPCGMAVKEGYRLPNGFANMPVENLIIYFNLVLLSAECREIFFLIDKAK